MLSWPNCDGSSARRWGPGGETERRGGEAVGAIPESGRRQHPELAEQWALSYLAISPPPAGGVKAPRRVLPTRTTPPRVQHRDELQRRRRERGVAKPDDR